MKSFLIIPIFPIDVLSENYTIFYFKYYFYVHYFFKSRGCENYAERFIVQLFFQKHRLRKLLLSQTFKRYLRKFYCFESNIEIFHKTEISVTSLNCEILSLIMCFTISGPIYLLHCSFLLLLDFYVADHLAPYPNEVIF